MEVKAFKRSRLRSVETFQLLITALKLIECQLLCSKLEVRLVKRWKSFRKGMTKIGMVSEFILIQKYSENQWIEIAKETLSKITELKSISIKLNSAKIRKREFENIVLLIRKSSSKINRVCLRQENLIQMKWKTHLCKLQGIIIMFTTQTIWKQSFDLNLKCSNWNQTMILSLTLKKINVTLMNL